MVGRHEPALPADRRDARASGEFVSLRKSVDYILFQMKNSTIAKIPIAF